MGPHSTFQQTILRVSDAGLFGRPVIITSSNYRFLVAEQLAETGVEADILLEPARWDSGPALAAGTESVRRQNPESIVVALAADHLVLDVAAFTTACRDAMAVARIGKIVTSRSTKATAIRSSGSC
jgi:mannose-1-phosphate guanylyltransferase/mannose-1-phosphate guanylyltransferase/mannose-6-phosphate isomerase